MKLNEKFKTTYQVDSQEDDNHKFEKKKVGRHLYTRSHPLHFSVIKFSIVKATPVFRLIQMKRTTQLNLSTRCQIPAIVPQMFQFPYGGLPVIELSLIPL
jgi:hypothetical protein